MKPCDTKTQAQYQHYVTLTPSSLVKKRKGMVMQIEKKTLINDRLRISKVFWKIRIPTINNFAVIYRWILLFS